MHDMRVALAGCAARRRGPVDDLIDKVVVALDGTIEPETAPQPVGENGLSIRSRVPGEPALDRLVEALGALGFDCDHIRAKIEHHVRERCLAMPIAPLAPGPLG